MLAPQGAGLGLKHSVLGEEIPGLDICGLYFLHLPSYHTGRVFDGGRALLLLFGSCTDYSANFLGSAILYVGTWLLPLHDFHLPAGSYGICSYPEHQLCHLLIIQPLKL